MPDDQRVYSDNEFAMILRKATELSSQAEPLAASSNGLTLREMKTAAAEAGIDPALVERAARMLPVIPSASAFERLVGGPLRHQQVAHFPTMLDEQSAASMLSAARISAGQHSGSNEGHSSALGMTWNDGGEHERLSVTARVEDEGTAITVAVDRRGTLTLVAVVSGLGMFVAGLAGGTLAEVSPALGLGTCIVGMGGAIAIARRYWVSSTKAVQARISGVVDAVVPVLVSAKEERANAKGEE